MAERTEQQICIKFCFNLGKSCAETIEMLQKAFKDECVGKTQIKEWYGRFKNGRTSVDSDSVDLRHEHRRIMSSVFVSQLNKIIV
ncbi:FLJ37770-like protein [Trichonephila clavipes]|uniref:FLJ37770-like protein n=1 Tax=Trichonephila clavipes TaxID=2585209 RepID=A0A8X6RVF0_TRICX|nr:FLJ37770-like protein [Trichonephila clavipes]